MKIALVLFSLLGVASAQIQADEINRTAPEESIYEDATISSSGTVDEDFIGRHHHLGPAPLPKGHEKETFEGVPRNVTNHADNKYHFEHPDKQDRHARHGRLLRKLQDMDDPDAEVRVIASYKNDVGKGSIEGHASVILEEFTQVKAVVLMLPASQVELLLADDNIDSVEEDGLVYPSAWVDGTQEWENYGVPLTQANSVDIPSSDTFGDCSDPNSFKVAIIDSGLKIDHPDSPCRNVVTDGQTKTNCVGQSFGTSDSWSNPFYSWHGTHVAGAMIARGGNGVGVTSTNPTNNNICWVICRVFDEGGGGATWSTVFSAVAWAIDVHKVRVINMSLSGGYSGQGQQFMDYAEENGVIVVAAAGNSAKYQYEYPSSYENVMSVGALDWKKFWGRFSTCNMVVDIAAPGVSMWGLDTQVRSIYGAYRYASGTSMATPIVSGIIARIWSQCPDCTSNQVSDCTISTADDLDYPWCYGAGLVQADDAYKCLRDVRKCC